MKSLSNYSMNLSEQEYHNYPAWSYSIIAKYARGGFSALATLHDKTTPNAAMRFGSLFDSFITRGKETLNHYVVNNVSVPDAERTALEYIASKTDLSFEEVTKFPEVLMPLCEECGYQTRWGFDARVKHLSVYKDYFDKLKSGKEIVSEEDWQDAVEMFGIFRNDPYLKTLFGQGTSDGIEYIYQAQFVTDWDMADRNIEIKIMPDLLVVNHKEKTIQPVDLKTSQNPAYEFPDNFVRMRYDLEAEVYTDVLRKVIDTQATEYSDYTILPFIFTDISRADKVPVSYTYDPSEGFYYEKNGKQYTYSGWKKLLEEIVSYETVSAKVPSYIEVDKPNDLRTLLAY